MDRNLQTKRAKSKPKASRLSDVVDPQNRLPLILLWIARLTASVVIVPLMLIAFGEFGRGPAGVREWIYLVLFPFGFSAGYLIGWRWPLPGGLISLVCLAISLIVIGRTFAPGPYVIWSVVAIPGVLYVIAGLWLRSNARRVI